MTMTQSLVVIWKTLTPHQRRRFVMLQLVALVMALSTVLGLAAVMTFLAVLADPRLLESHEAFRLLSRVLDHTPGGFFVELGGGILLLLVIGMVANVLGLRATQRFAFSVGDRVREVLFAEYLRRDYLFHVRAGAGRLMDNVLYQSDRVTLTLLNTQILVTNSVLTLLVVVSIAIVNLAIALVGVVAVAASYAALYGIIRRRVARNGALQVRHSAERVGVVGQALQGIKYLQVAGVQRYFGTRQANSSQRLSRTLADTQFIAQFPRYVLECLAGIGLIACAAFASRLAPDGAWLAQLSFIGFAGFRLLPAAQQMYHAFVIVRTSRPAIELLALELRQLADAGESKIGEAPAAAPVRSVAMSAVSFRYAPELPLVLRDVNLRIPAGCAVGIVGSSGAGKTTLVDLLLGLLTPVDGKISWNGETPAVSHGSAQRCGVGYVPQDVIILDATVRENVAFGVDADSIDDARVREVVRQAGASEFVEALPEGYSSRISGTIANLSGGQRQRIGLARALYHDPSLLVLDEATNALDADTERAIIDTVIRNRGGRTLIIVAHGASVIGACDRVYELRDGTLHERSPPVRAVG